jgi:hypothetical protein
MASESTGHGPMVVMGATGYLRFRPCPGCGSRKRTLLDVGDRLHGRCLRCGQDLGEPLATASLPADHSLTADTGWEVAGRALSTRLVPRVQVVHRDGRVRALLVRLLGAAGFRTSSARDGVKGLLRSRQVARWR